MTGVDAQTAGQSQAPRSTRARDWLILGCGGFLLLAGVGALVALLVFAPGVRQAPGSGGTEQDIKGAEAPQWVPVYPGAKTTVSANGPGVGSYTFTPGAATTTPELLDFYRTRFEAEGYVVKAYGIYHGQALRAVTPARQVIVAVREASPRLTVSVVYGPRERLSELSGE